jgi:hypothetical protein
MSNETKNKRNALTSFRMDNAAFVLFYDKLKVKEISKTKACKELKIKANKWNELVNKYETLINS